MIKHKEDQTNKNSGLAGKAEQWVKRHLLQLAVGAFLILIATIVVLTYAIREPKAAPLVEGSSIDIPTSTHDLEEGMAERLLDGIIVPQEDASLLPRAVMIENHVDARPISGINEASLVIEAPVEGGITRLMAIFDAKAEVDEIGPIRSARPYYVEWARGINAIYAHVGGSPEALNRIGGLIGFRNLDEMAGETYFWRSRYRYAPHNVYTSSENLNRVQKDREWESESFTPWTYSPESDDFTPGTVTEITVPYKGSYKVRWVYEPETNSYARYLAGSRDKDKQGAGISAKNILVISTDQKVLDEKGRLYIKTTGEGRGWYFGGGEVIDILWSRESNDFYKITTADGRDVAFYRGNTWIEIASLPDYEPIY